MAAIAVLREGRMDAALAAGVSASGLDRALSADAELCVAPLVGDERIYGAFERSASPGLVRGSGGHTVRARDGVLFVHLAVPRVDALVECDAARFLNRHVRPLLSALGRFAAPVAYFGRDWIALAHAPVGFCGFAHDASSGRAVFEAFVAVDAPYVDEERASFRGKPPVTMARAKPMQIASIADATIEAYLRAFEAEEIAMTPPPAAAPRDACASPWTVTRDEAMGVAGAGLDDEGVMRAGGEIMGSRDAIAELAFDKPGAVLFGARPDTLRAIVAEARRAITA